MSSPIGVSDTLALLERLRTILREGAAKEEAILADWRERETSETKGWASAVAGENSNLEAQVAAAESALQASRQHEIAKLRARMGRIEQAHRSTRKRALSTVEEEEGRAKYHLQKRSLDGTRQKEASLAQANVRWEELRRAVAESQAGLQLKHVAAQRVFRNAGEFQRLLSPEHRWPEPNAALDEFQLMSRVADLSIAIDAELVRFQQNLVFGFFRIFPLWLLTLTALSGYLAIVLVLPLSGIQLLALQQASLLLAGSLLLTASGFFVGKHFIRPLAEAIARDLAEAFRSQELALQKAEERFRQDQQRIEANWEAAALQIDQEWHQALSSAEQARAVLPGQWEEQKVRLLQRNEASYQRRITDLEAAHARRLEQMRQESALRIDEVTRIRERKRSVRETEFHGRWQVLERAWALTVDPLRIEIKNTQQSADARLPIWTDLFWNEWHAPVQFQPEATLGSLEVDLEKLAEACSDKKRLAFPGPSRFSLPLRLVYPEQGSILFETSGAGTNEVIGALNSVILHLLATSPAGMLDLTLVDPVGLGQSFASLMHLADFDENQIKSRIWTQPSQIEERLGELTEHMEKVIQMYLRNEFATVAEYNAHAGSVAEKYHVLVVAGFPVNFSELSGRRLVNIAANGARCGVFLLMLWDQRYALPHGFVADDLRKSLVRLVGTQHGFVIGNSPLPGTEVRLSQPPPAALAKKFLRQVGVGSRGSRRVEVPFSEVAPLPAEVWSLDTRDELAVAIGRSGASKRQYFALGKGTRQHALIAGKTGSGKSNLFHVLITNFALWCSPAEVEFYLVDFKKGVEFKCYANRRLPHARVIAIESDREFGLSVLQRVDEELHRRGDLFRKAGVQDFAGFRRANDRERLPRCLLLIDEFQELFTDEDRIAQGAAVLLDRIVRQGRAFGIHVVLGSQTLGGAYTLARATIGQMVVRIALQCNEADAYLIMDENNSAPRLLSRPGEGIYNDLAGLVQANRPFQAVWLPDETRDQYLSSIREQAERENANLPGPFIYEGNAPADIRENRALRQSLAQPPVNGMAPVRVWLGEPNAIKGPTEVRFERQSGSHLLIVGQNEESALTLVAAAIIAIAAQFGTNPVRIVLLESTAPDSAERLFLDRLVQLVPNSILRPNRLELAAILNRLANEGDTIASDPEAGPPCRTFIFVASLHSFKPLRQEDEFAFSGPSSTDELLNPARAFLQILMEGPARGVHVIASLDTYGNVMRFLGRKALSEFQWRALFQMSASDSASLIDSPDAGNLGLHRALLFNEREGYIEKFRPYALMEEAALSDIAKWAERSWKVA